MPNNILSKQEAKRLRKKLRALEKEKSSVRAEIARGSEFTDAFPTKTPEVRSAYDRLSTLEQQIEKTKKLLAESKIVDRAKSSPEVQPQSIVEIEFPKSNSTMRVRISDAGLEEENLKVISSSSPIGQAILGAKPGDHRQVKLPNGTTQEIIIKKIL